MMAAGDNDDAIRLGPLEDLVGYHMRRASAVVGADFARAVSGTGMRQVLVGILSIIAANPGINQGMVGRALNIQRANMVSLVNELVDAGLVTREVSAEDRRAFTFTLTDRGRTTLDDALVRIRDHEERLLGSMSAQERATLLDLLSRIEARGD
ncbi:MarR family winged helix-turn-helix transcriptional regulator [Sphingomonas metalli]|jgi:DNA-binding MarR family transcriptional regulator|nr:MarR family transcriptional regulator [Sphingomonas metalli]